MRGPPGGMGSSDAITQISQLLHFLWRHNSFVIHFYSFPKLVIPLHLPQFVLTPLIRMADVLFSAHVRFYFLLPPIYGRFIFFKLVKFVLPTSVTCIFCFRARTTPNPVSLFWISWVNYCMIARREARKGSESRPLQFSFPREVRCTFRTSAEWGVGEGEAKVSCLRLPIPLSSCVSWSFSETLFPHL